MGCDFTASERVYDKTQNYWQLASIQSASLGLPGLIIGGQIAIKSGNQEALYSIVIGNLFLWIIGLAIISMAAPGRDNAIEIVKKYLGKAGAILSALFLISAFLDWYILQIHSSVVAISNNWSFQGNQLKWGAAFGMITALLSIGGIRFIKWFSVCVFPFLVLYLLYTSMSYPRSIVLGPYSGVSLTAIIQIIAVGLPGIVNLPTFFRHSRSSPDSFLGLSLMIVFTILFQIFAIVVGYTDLASVKATGTIDAVLLVGFVLLSMVAVNLVNIYFASAGWEMILPHRRSAKEYAIVGLLGTMAYTFLQISSPMEFLENMADNFIGSLGVVLAMAFLMKMVVRHRPRPGEQWVNVGCWLFGGTVGTVMGLSEGDAAKVLIASICASAIAFLVVVFVEEGIWSFRKIWKRE